MKVSEASNGEDVIDSALTMAKRVGDKPDLILAKLAKLDADFLASPVSRDLLIKMGRAVPSTIRNIKLWSWRKQRKSTVHV